MPFRLAPVAFASLLDGTAERPRDDHIKLRSGETEHTGAAAGVRARVAFRGAVVKLH
ncbi:hypothetical protein [Accumulibacter sp.]|uniref:hypothetical protein n=1 Tax=Accumulibacter sp. TaxID=2053492 RepID=UPI0025D4B738|nr:hypothetical protein [Accumulibacter sp.]MCM8614096.1 hypothetical protein [Accumulibacter sp.]MCM8637880.1 hypothetical protein [Accumulibacter sp.]MCM8641287.1 hypothetical protein [Accumulibacter sp.]